MFILMSRFKRGRHFMLLKSNHLPNIRSAFLFLESQLTYFFSSNLVSMFHSFCIAQPLAGTTSKASGILGSASTHNNRLPTAENSTSNMADPKWFGGRLWVLGGWFFQLLPLRSFKKGRRQMILCRRIEVIAPY